MTALQENGHKVSPINIKELLPGIYNEVIVRLQNDKHLLNLPENMDSDRFKFWKKTAAGLFSRDALRFTREKPSGEWLLIEGKNYKTVVRLLDADEHEEFTALKLVHGKIKDKYYMHLKTVVNGNNINWNTGYIINKTENELNEFEEAELEKAKAEEALNATVGEQNKPKKSTPKAGSLFK